jgi:Ca-activated chloride channel family protein
MKHENKKLYLKHKISSGLLGFTIIFGFVFGATLGHFIFSASSTDVIKLSMVYSSEKSTWISESQQLFYTFWDQERLKDPSLKPIILDFQPYGSGDSLISLLNGEIKPTIWSPASNIWVPILNSKWTQISHQNQIIAPNYSRIVYSPLVIATWEDFNKSHPITGVNTLHDLIMAHPDLVKMAHTDPRESNSGFMTMVLLVSGYLKMNPTKITIEDISNQSVIKWIKDVESSAIFYGKSTGFLGKYMRDQGPNALQVSILYENLIKDYSLEAEKDYGQKIIAIYPEEGTLFSDHPFCILNAPWVTENQKMVANKYLEFLNSKELIKKAIFSGFRPINLTFLEDPAIKLEFDQEFNPIYGISNDSSIITELLPPSDGNIIARIPDLWLLTRNSV